MHSLAIPLLRLAILILLVGPQATAQAASERELRVMSLNAQWNGAWTHEDVAHVIAASGADLIGLQEYASSESILVLARLLGFHAAPEAEILSRFPIVESRVLGHGWSAGVAVIEIDPRTGSRVGLVNHHLSSYPYTPHDLVAGNLDAAGAVRQERREHLVPELSEAMAAVALLRGRGLPVLLTGDFNAPSHLDWREADAAMNAGHSVAWPMSRALEAMGMRDAFRSAHPDPAKRPGYTWSVQPEIAVGKHDRIDFVYVSEGARTVAARIVGEPGSEHTDLAFSPWATDHRAVLARVRLAREAKAPLRTTLGAYRAHAPIGFTLSGEPEGSIGQLEIYRRGEFPIRNRPVAWGDAPEIGAKDVHLTLDSNTAKGTWPLPAGHYDAYLRSADAGGSLAAVPFEVAPDAELIPPGGLRAAWDPESVTLSWRNRAIPDHRVLVERRVDQRAWERLAELAPGTSVYRDARNVDVAGGHLYEYRVSAVDEVGASLPSSPVSASARPVLSLSRQSSHEAELDGSASSASGTGPVTLHFSGLRGRPDDWIAVFPAGAKPTEDTAQAWKYTNGTQSAGGSRTDGSVFFEGLPPGGYEAHLLCCGGYESITRLGFEVAGPIPPQLQLDKSGYHAGEPIRVSFRASPGHAEDWIGLYRASDDPRTAWYRTWLYANGTQQAGGSHRVGEVIFQEGLAAGTYVARFFRAGSYESIATTPLFSVDTD